MYTTCIVASSTHIFLAQMAKNKSSIQWKQRIEDLKTQIVTSPDKMKAVSVSVLHTVTCVLTMVPLLVTGSTGESDSRCQGGERRD